MVRMNKRRSIMTRDQFQEISITRMLIAVILVFLAGNAIKIITYFIRGKTLWNDLSILMIVNSASCNFIIYCIFSTKIRTALSAMIKEWIRIILRKDNNKY